MPKKKKIPQHVLEKIEEKKNSIKAQVGKIAAERDKLRELYEDLEGVVNDCDMACDDFAQAIKLMESGLDEMSQYL